jgi:hypothetical protein
MNQPQGFQIHKFEKGKLARCYLCGSPPSCLATTRVPGLQFGNQGVVQVNAFCAQCALELSGLDQHWPFEEQP